MQNSSNDSISIRVAYEMMFISFGLLLWYGLEMLNLIHTLTTETKPKLDACIDSVYTKESARHIKAFVKCMCIEAVVIFKGDNKTQRLLIVCCQYSNKFQ